MKLLFRLISALILAAAASGGAIAQNAAGQPGVPSVTDMRFDPSAPETGTKLKLSLKMDSAARAEVKWSINGDEVHMEDYDGLEGQVSLDKPVKAGDRISVSVTPYDSAGTAGEQVTRTVTCGNAPPFLRVANQNLAGDKYTAKIECKDPENDPVTFSLQGPPGMRIDPKGNISWKIDGATSGSFTIVVTGKDDKGGQGVLTYSIGLRR